MYPDWEVYLVLTRCRGRVHWKDRAWMHARHLHSLIKPDYITHHHGNSMGVSNTKVMAGWLVANNSLVNWQMVQELQIHRFSRFSVPFWLWPVKKKCNYDPCHRMHITCLTMHLCTEVLLCLRHCVCMLVQSVSYFPRWQNTDMQWYKVRILHFPRKGLVTFWKPRSDNMV